MLNTQYFGVSNGAFQLGSIGPNWYAPFGNLIFFFKKKFWVSFSQYVAVLFFLLAFKPGMNDL